MTRWIPCLVISLIGAFVVELVLTLIGLLHFADTFGKNNLYGGPLPVGRVGGLQTLASFGGYPPTFHYLPFIINVLLTAAFFLFIARWRGVGASIAAVVAAVGFLTGFAVIGLQPLVVSSPGSEANLMALWVITVLFGLLFAVVWRVFRTATHR